MARQRFGKLRHIWADNELHMNLRIRLYKACICSVMVYGSEAWRFTADVCKMLNGANSQMMAIITGKTPHQEASAKWQTFNIIRWLRARRLKWAGQILRMESDRMIKQALYGMFMEPHEGDLLMDIPKVKSWRALCTYAIDEDYWNARVRALGQNPVLEVNMSGHIEPEAEFAFTINS